ncbi:MAG: YbaB/EbfC family nucleoid-associated protein [Alphaproteobacteria bacterium]|nr:YbaB/EbfC family nucleoid-associated protein [Alphaproteobacteria bacterium]
MKNLANMMKQAQEMQAKMGELQARLEQVEVTGAAGGGMVTVTMTAKGAMRRVRIDPSLVQPAEVGVLEDLIVAASNDARAKAETLMQEETRKLLGGLQLPAGMSLPI